jgi:hypothetical protein
MVINCCHPESANQKSKAIIEVSMMAPKPSGDAVLGRHHPPVVPLTGTGIFRTTIGYINRAVFSFVRIQPFVMAKRNISVRHQTNSMAQGSQ